MKPAEIPENEAYRLDALHSLDLLDTPFEEEFDAIVRLGKSLFEVDSCLVSLIDSERQWFKAKVGLDAFETPRDISFCGHAIHHDEIFVVEDASMDDRFHDNPLVTSAPFIRFYAGAPICLPNGYRIGTVCILSPKPKAVFSESDARRLKDLAAMAVTAIRARALRARLDEVRGLSDLYQAALYASPSPIACADPEGVILDCNQRFAALCEVEAPIGLKVNEAVPFSFADWSPAIMYEKNLVDIAVRIERSGEKLQILRHPGGFLFIGE